MHRIIASTLQFQSAFYFFVDLSWLFTNIGTVPLFQRTYYLPLSHDFVLHAGLKT